MRDRILMVGLALAAGTAQAQDAGWPARRGDFGVRYWLSTGETNRSHNAQVADPAAGNPTSVLLYENLDASVLELFGRTDFGGRWFLKGNLGVGWISRGSLDDEDFSAGQAKFSDTTSAVRDGRIGYGAIDIGRQWSLGDGRMVIGLFAGYGQWTEDMDAYGAIDHLGFIGGDIDPGVLVISNKVVWRALRVGLAGDVALGERLRFSTDLAFAPYARVRNEDSHHLRADLGPVPNIILKGEGWGVQLDAELRYEVARRTDVGLGYRYWYMEVRHGERRVPNVAFPDVPLVELYSRRSGLTLSVRRVW